jgi:hypothetical protein
MRAPAILLLVLFVGAGLARAASPAPARPVSVGAAEACFRAAGSTILHRPALLPGFLSPAARDWFIAGIIGQRATAKVGVAYFSSSQAAAAAHRHALVVTKKVNQSFGFKLTSAQLNSIVRVTGPVLYWWVGLRPTLLALVQRCVLR